MHDDIGNRSILLLKMPSNKSPGNDGLSKEFYSCIFDTIGSILMESLNHVFDRGGISSSQIQAFISLTEEKVETSAI